jgi:hypothetical protein
MSTIASSNGRLAVMTNCSGASLYSPRRPELGETMTGGNSSLSADVTGVAGEISGELAVGDV